MLFGACNFCPFAFAKSLVNKQSTLSSRTCDDGAILAAIWCPYNIGRGGWLGPARDNQLVMSRGGNILGVGCDTVVKGERVA
jgi:hypothetical protein